MDVKSHGRTLWEGIVRFVGGNVADQLQSADPNNEAFYAEVHQIEKKLEAAPTHPSRAIKNRSKLLESVTEQQKFVDMSG